MRHSTGHLIPRQAARAAGLRGGLWPDGVESPVNDYCRMIKEMLQEGGKISKDWAAFI
jgi:hypothetical protein